MVKLHTPQKERFRNIPCRIEYGIDFTNYEVKGYYMGTHFVPDDKLTKLHFDCLQFLTKTRNVKKGGNQIIASGYRNNEKTTTILLLECK